MPVLVEVPPVPSADVQLRDLLRVGNRFGWRAQGCGSSEGPVGRCSLSKCSNSRQPPVRTGTGRARHVDERRGGGDGARRAAVQVPHPHGHLGRERAGHGLAERDPSRKSCLAIQLRCPTRSRCM